MFGAKIGKNVIIRPSVKVTYPWKISIGDFSWIGDNVSLYSLGKITIEDNVVVSQKSYLCTGSHDYLQVDFPIYQKPIHIGAQSWIAADVYIAPGVKIGNGTVVAARSSVYKDLPPNKICKGNPAKVIRNRIDNEE